MTPKQQFICKLLSIILGAVVALAVPTLTYLQGRNNKAVALRNHDEVRRRHRFPTHTPVPEPPRAPELSRRTDMDALAESVRVAADNAADDTVTVTVQPMWFQSKPQRMTVKELRLQVSPKQSRIPQEQK
jgi:hypothetical protein